MADRNDARAEEAPPIWPAGFEAHVVAQAFGAQRLSSYTIGLEAWRRGLQVSFRGAKGVGVEISDGERTVSFNGSRSMLTTPQANRTVEMKHRAAELLRRAGVPVARSQVFITRETDVEEVVEIARRDYTWPVVIKPESGSMGSGVFINISTAEELRRCWTHLVEDRRTQRILLEEHADGEDYRVYVVGETVGGVIRKIPAFVVGDGRRTVRQLIRAKNAQRRKNPFLSKGLIRPDLEIDMMLERQGLAYETVLEAGHRVQLRQKANTSAGGDAEDVTEELPEAVKAAAVAAVRAIPELAAAGVDVIYDPTQEDREHPVHTILELNARAHIGLNMYPSHGQGQDVPKAIVDHFFPETAARTETLARTLAINFDDVLVPLRSGAAEEVRIAPAPEHLHPVRRVYHLPEAVSLPAARKDRLLAASRVTGVAGALQSGMTQLIVGGTQEQVEDFAARFVRIARTELPAPRDWDGVLLQGFSLREDEILRRPEAPATTT